VMQREKDGIRGNGLAACRRPILEQRGGQVGRTIILSECGAARKVQGDSDESASTWIGRGTRLRICTSAAMVVGHLRDSKAATGKDIGG